LAALHNVDRALFDEAGLPSYDADTYRTRRLSDLDRAAATGHVPTGLLARWERSLEDVSLWRFAPTPTHGALTGAHVLAVFDDDRDAGTGRVRGLTGWEAAKVADPADDFAALVTSASHAAFDSVLEAYAHARVDRPDKHLERRARLAGELRLVSELLTAVGLADQNGVEACTAKMRALDSDITEQDLDDEPVVPTAPAVQSFTVTSVETGHPDEVQELMKDPEVADPSEVTSHPEQTPAGLPVVKDHSPGSNEHHPAGEAPEESPKH